MKQNNIQIPEGYKNSSLGIIPNDWEVKNVKELVKYVGGGAFSSNDSCDIGVKWLKIANVGINKIKWNEKYFLPFNYMDKYSEWSLLEGDLVMALTRPILDGKLKISFLNKRDTPALLNQRVAKIVALNICNDVFIYYSMQMTRFISEIESQMLGTDPPNASFDNLYKQSLLLPPLPQQQKIAEILGTWDEAIEKQSQLIDKLTERKRGLMQQLLSGKKRLVGFNEEWKEVRLGEMAFFRNGKAHENEINENGEYILINSKFISSDGNIKKYTDKQLCPLYKDEVVMVMSDVPNGKAIAKCFYINEDNYYTLNQRICALKVMNCSDPKFLFYILNRNVYYLSFDDGAKQTNLRKDEVLDCLICCPSLPEQTAIANILTAADKEIELAKSKLELLRSQKSGLIQQLLTGKTRVKI